MSSDISNGILHRLNATEDVILEREGNLSRWVYGPLMVGNHPGYCKKRTLVKFKDIPSSCTNIQWAKIYLYFLYSHKASFNTVNEAPYLPRPLQIHQVKKSWQEDPEATRDYRLSGTSWHVPYLGLDGSDAVKHPMDVVTIFPGRPSGYVEFNITEAAHNWRAGQPNYGVVVSAVNEDVPGRDTRFYSHRSSENQPFMTVFSAYQ